MGNITRQQSDNRLSRVVTHGGVAYLAGLTADNRKASMKVQTEEVLKKIDALLKAGGSSKSSLLSATIYISDMSLKGQMDGAWCAWVDPKNTPARSCVQAALVSPETLVEIMCMAAQE